jgi:hypothetical protein
VKTCRITIGSILETPGHASTRLYSVEGIHLGALNQEDVIELASIDRKAAGAPGKERSMFVPKEMIEAGISSGLFTLTEAE